MGRWKCTYKMSEMNKGLSKLGRKRTLSQLHGTPSVVFPIFCLSGLSLVAVYLSDITPHR